MPCRGTQRRGVQRTPGPFERARAFDPKRLHVTDRLADVARRQHAAGAMPPVAAGGNRVEERLRQSWRLCDSGRLTRQSPSGV